MKFVFNITILDFVFRISTGKSFHVSIKHLLQCNCSDPSPPCPWSPSSPHSSWEHKHCPGTLQSSQLQRSAQLSRLTSLSSVCWSVKTTVSPAQSNILSQNFCHTCDPLHRSWSASYKWFLNSFEFSSGFLSLLHWTSLLAATFRALWKFWWCSS